MLTSTLLVHAAIDLSDVEDYIGALNLLRRAIAIDPNNAQAYFERAMVMLNLGRNADAIADFDRALSINSEFPGAYYWRSCALTSLGNHQKAADDRLRDLYLHCNGSDKTMGINPQKWVDCAEAFINAGNSQKARELLEDYFDLYAGKVTSYVCFETSPMRLLASLLIQSGDSAQACELAKRAYSSNYQCPADILTYATALESSGNLVDARRTCAEALEANAQLPGAIDLYERLANT
ncbi:MAG: tetratricopeptide repeat protein [Cyanobacteria bacterium P01_D01_bin.6]